MKKILKRVYSYFFRNKKHDRKQFIKKLLKVTSLDYIDIDQYEDVDIYGNYKMVSYSKYFLLDLTKKDLDKLKGYHNYGFYCIPDILMASVKKHKITGSMVPWHHTVKKVTKV